LVKVSIYNSSVQHISNKITIIGVTCRMYQVKKKKRESEKYNNKKKKKKREEM
jgi:hypothetical protein